MKILRFEMVGGASGDMILAGLIGLGAKLEALNTELAALCHGTDLTIHFETVCREGITGVTAHVHAHGEPADHHHHDHAGHHHHHHDHRTFADIRHLLSHSQLPAKSRALAELVFQRLAEAEGRVHGKPADEVHFHEVGALDSIADIVGICRAFEMLDADGISVGDFPAGHGTIECQHGVMPNPAPATMELLAGSRIVSIDEPYELVTPTAAAVLTALPQIELTSAKLLKAVNVFGHRTLIGRPNLLRVSLWETDAVDSTADNCVMLECDIDDLSPEIIGHVTGLLFDAGALDVVTLPVMMKKQRPGVRLSVLTNLGNRAALERIIFRETTTFGLRVLPVERVVLEREIKTIVTPYGEIAVKVGYRHGEIMSESPEYESCRAASELHGIPLKDVYAAVYRALKEKK